MDLISDRRALHRIPELDRNLPETLNPGGKRPVRLF